MTVSYRNDGRALRPRKTLARKTISLARFEDLPPSQQRAVVAFAACWRVAARPPRRAELLAVGISLGGTTLFALYRGGFIKRHPRTGLWQVTEHALAELGYSIAEAAE